MCTYIHIYYLNIAYIEYSTYIEGLGPPPGVGGTVPCSVRVVPRHVRAVPCRAVPCRAMSVPCHVRAGVPCHVRAMLARAIFVRSVPCHT